jgi:hypothetical protein
MLATIRRPSRSLRSAQKSGVYHTWVHPKSALDRSRLKGYHNAAIIARNCPHRPGPCAFSAVSQRVGFETNHEGPKTRPLRISKVCRKMARCNTAMLASQWKTKTPPCNWPHQVRPIDVPDSSGLEQITWRLTRTCRERYTGRFQAV